MSDERNRKTRAWLVTIALAALAGAAIACSGAAAGDGAPSDDVRRQEQALVSAGCRSTVCVRAGMAGCWSGPMESSCRSCENTYGQGFAVSFWSGCNKEFAAYGSCLKGSAFACSETGVATPTDCKETAAAVSACMGGGSADAGTKD